MRSTTSRLLFLLALALVPAAPALAVGGGTTPLVALLATLLDDWLLIAALLALAGFVWAVLQIGIGRGPGAFGDAIRWIVVVLIIGGGVFVFLTFAGVGAAVV